MISSTTSLGGNAFYTGAISLMAVGIVLPLAQLVSGTNSLVQAQTTGASVELQQSSTPISESIANTPTVDFTDWSAIRIKAYGESLATVFPKPLAVVEIPKLRLHAPLYDGVDDLTLDRGLGHVPGTALPEQDGNLAVAGHRDSFFRALKDIHEGDMIRVINSGATATYVVEHTSVVDPTDIDVLKPQSKSALTLVTCFPFYFVGHAPKRFIVSAVLTQRSLVQPQSPASIPALEQADSNK
jgi:sortase A